MTQPDVPSDFDLLDNASTTGSGVRVSGGNYDWLAWGTWDGATAQLQFSPDYGTTWIDFAGVLLTANGGWSGIPIPAGFARVSISGAGGSTSIDSKLGGVP